jgi:hypothetical protein
MAKGIKTGATPTDKFIVFMVYNNSIFLHLD